MLSFKRRLYRLVLHLHPAPFRNRFAREMSLDFEDALATFGFSHLLLDAIRSLCRQWTKAPVFHARATQAPIALHPLLAGQYLAIDDNNLKPFELLRGSLLFAVLLCALSLVVNHGGNYIHAGRLPGLPANQAESIRSAQDGPFQPTPGGRNAGLIHPDENLRSHPESARYFVRPAGQSDASPMPETWPNFLLRCAIISAVVWLVSLLVRRSRSVGVRIGLVALGVIAIVAAAAYVPAPAPPVHAQALPGRFALIDHPPGVQPLRDPSFETATIRLSHSAPPSLQIPDSPTPASALSGTPGIESGDSIRITLPIRSLIASVSGMPAGSQPRIVGGPAWLDSDTYDIQAKIDGADLAALRQMSPAQRQYQVELMEQSLLVTRFHLKAHEETRTPAASRLAPAQPPVEVLVIDHIDRPSEN